MQNKAGSLDEAVEETS